MLVWPANNDVLEIVEQVKQKHHLPRLAEARIAVEFCDSKPFTGGRFNWGKTSKFSASAKIWHPRDKKYDFKISICADAWLSILDGNQREALLDLHLERCQVEYEPVTVEINGKKKPQKDEWGRTEYTNVIKTDADGVPKWKVVPLDLNVLQENVIRYGCWCESLLDFKTAIDSCKKG